MIRLRDFDSVYSSRALRQIDGFTRSCYSQGGTLMKQRIHRRNVPYQHAAVILPVIIGMVFLLLILGRRADAGAFATESGETVNLEAAREVVFVLDVSGSMFSTDPGNQMKKAVEDSIRKLSELEGKAAVIPFSDQIGTEYPLSKVEGGQADGACSFIQALSYTRGDTDIGSALRRAVSILQEDASGQDRRVILVTDGMIDLPHEQDEEAAEKASLTMALTAAEQARDMRIRFDTIGLGTSGAIDENLLGYLAERTGGSFIRAEDVSYLSGILLTLSTQARETLSSPELETETETEFETESAALLMTETELQYTEKPEQTEGMETETEGAPAMIGNISGPVRLGGLIPQLCRASVDLGALFSLRAEDSRDKVPATVTAQVMEGRSVRVQVNGTLLIISGLENGTSIIRVVAARRGKSSEVEIAADVQALIGSMQTVWMIAAMIGLLIAAAVILLFQTQTRCLSGYLRYYVVMEQQKIFGVPAMNQACLQEYRKGVKLSEIVKDTYLEGTELAKVKIYARKGGAVLASKTKSCIIQDEHGHPVEKLPLETTCRFRIFCAANGGTAIITALYTSGPEPAEDEPRQEERTRLLV